jgi:hypothetical protein
MRATNMNPVSFLMLLMIMCASLYSQQPSNSQDVLSRATLGPNLDLLAGEDDVRAVHRLAKELVTPPMKDFMALSTRHQEILIIAASDSLKGDDYLEMVATVLRYVADGSISPGVGSIALSPGMSKEGVLAVNHADPRIAEVLPKLLARYRDDPDTTDLIQMLISGEAKQIHIESCESYGIKPAQVISKVASGGSASSSLINTAPVPKKAPEAKPLSRAPTEEPSSALSWSFIALLIAGLIALLWLALNRRL